MPVLQLIYQQLGDLRVQSNPAVGRQESHECGDLLAMDGQDKETAGKRKTKNSTSLVEEEKDLAKAKQESEKQIRQEQKLKRKEDEDLRMALAVSKLQVSNDKPLAISEQKAERKESGDHLISVQTATSSETTQLHLLGTVASSSTALFDRISQGKDECDPNDQVLGRDDFSPFSSFDEDQKPESSDSLLIMHDADGLTYAATSDEVMDSAMEGSSQQQISPEISEALKQKHLGELETQYHFNKTMAKFSDEDLNDLNGEKKVETRDECASSVSSGGTFKYPPTVELNSQSSGSQKSSLRSRSSGRSGSCNNSCRTFTKEMYTQLMTSSDQWFCEEDVVLELRNLSLSETKVSIHSEVMAGIVFDSRPAVCDVSQLIKAQARNFERAHKELASDLSKIKQDETRRIQQARRILEKKMEKCDGKSRELDSRVKATAIFGDGHDSVAALEVALEEAHHDNKSLRDRVKVLELTLKEMVSNGITHSSLKGKGIVTRIKTEPSSSSSNPAKSPLPSSVYKYEWCSLEWYNSASSATSLPSSLSSSSCVDSPMVGLEFHRFKRELSPASRYKDEDFVFKKPKSFQTPWAKWNSDGIDEADEFVKVKGKYFIQTKSVDHLNYFRSRLTEALEDFKNLFPKDLPPEEGMSRRDREPHESYHNLRLDLAMPGTDERTCSVHFYYGKFLGCINNTLNKRARFRKHPSDNWKINAFIKHLGKNEATVVEFLGAERNLRKMEERSPCVVRKFQDAYSLLCQPNAEQPYWLHRSNFKNIRDNIRDRIPVPMSDRDALYNDSLKQFNNFFYNLHSHEVINFHDRARSFATQQANNFNGGGPQVKN